MSENRIVFVVLPYKHKNPAVVKERVEMAERYCALLMRRGFFPLCTASFGHHIIQTAKIPDTQEFWQGYCREMIRICGQIHVLALDGWEDSTGLKDELNTIRQTQKETKWLTPDRLLHELSIG
jgi:hypothetical protein